MMGFLALEVLYMMIKCVAIENDRSIIFREKSSVKGRETTDGLISKLSNNVCSKLLHIHTKKRMESLNFTTKERRDA